MDSTPMTTACSSHSNLTGTRVSNHPRCDFAFGELRLREMRRIYMNTKLVRVALLAAALTATLPIRSAAQTGTASPVAPRRDLVQSVVQEAYNKFKDDQKGK